MTRRSGGPAVGGSVVLLAIVSLVGCVRPSPPAMVIVRDARAFEAKQGSPAAAYVTILNGSDSADVLDSVTSPASHFVSAHAQRETNGFVTMTPLDRPTIAAHDSLVFAPGGDHLMLEALEQDRNAGDQLPLTFWLHHTGPIAVTARVTPYGS